MRLKKLFPQDLPTPLEVTVLGGSGVTTPELSLTPREIPNPTHPIRLVLPGAYHPYFFHSQRMLARKQGKRIHAPDRIDMQAKILEPTRRVRYPPITSPQPISPLMEAAGVTRGGG